MLYYNIRETMRLYKVLRHNVSKIKNDKLIIIIVIIIRTTHPITAQAVDVTREHGFSTDGHGDVADGLGEFRLISKTFCKIKFKLEIVIKPFALRLSVCVNVSKILLK